MALADDLAAIDAAIASGERTVQFSDRMVTYRSIQELTEARAIIAGKIRDQPKQILAYSNKGF